MSEKKAIVVGAGGISGAWFPPLAAHQVTVVAVVDLNLANAEKAIERFELSEAEAFDDLDAALAGVPADFVVDLTVPVAHGEVTCKALNAGLDVLGEKPMANSIADAQKMVAASRLNGRMYMCSQSRRYDPKHVCLREQVNELGELTTINCDFYLGAHFDGFRAAMDHVLLLDMAIHHFDMARMISGCEPLSVYTHEFNPKGSWYNHGASALCIFEMTNGVVFTYSGSWCSEGLHTSWNGDWRFVGTRGSVNYVRNEISKSVPPADAEAFIREVEPEPIQAKALEYNGQSGALAEFLDSLENSSTPQGLGEDNIHSLAMVFAAVESAKRGEKVMIAELFEG